MALFLWSCRSNFFPLIRCNGKQSCTFDGRAGCVLGVCGSNAGFNNYFGNPCDDGTSKCLRIEHFCIAGKVNAMLNGTELYKETNAFNFRTKWPKKEASFWQYPKFERGGHEYPRTNCAKFSYSN